MNAGRRKPEHCYGEDEDPGTQGLRQKPLAVSLALGLVIASAVAYFLVWSALKHGGCGPPRYSTEGRILVFAPFAVPAIATVVISGVAAKLKWPLRTTVVTGLLTILATGALEILIFLLEFTAGNCGE